MSLQIIATYNKALEDLYNHVGFTPDWKEFPIEDRTLFYWGVYVDEIRYSETAFGFENDPTIYPLLKHRAYNKTIYRGEDLTLVLIDTKVNLTQLAVIFNNSLEIEI